MTFYAVAAYGRSAGSARVRIFDWLDYLQVDAQTSTYLGTSRNSMSAVALRPRAVFRAERKLRSLATRVGDSTVLLSRKASPFSNGGVETKLLSRAGRGVYDFDDALMYTPAGIRERLWSHKRSWRASVLAADMVIAGNDYLAEHASDLGANVVVIPSCVNVSEYPQKQNYELGASPRAVWVGSPAGERYLLRIADSLLALHKDLGLRLSVVSAGSASLGPLDRLIDRYTWTPGVAAREMLRADLGIMPIDDSQWSRGKCAYKLLQYGAVGLPLVGSPVGANARVVGRGDGLAPISSEEWYDAVRTIVQESPARRSQRGLAAQNLVRAEYSFASWAETWREALVLPSST